MSTGEEDRIARSVALEKTYVHDVYDHMSALQYPEHRNTTPWPKVKKFLNDLEPGSIVCDVGCGNGKYLKVNPSIFKVGSDRCHKLTQIAKDDDNEVLLCDNLTLPFRDESFDAVLSIAVIHHFATKERRVGALRELARVLRIGGRLMITVWAMEQKDRKFETQDVLVQWHHPQVFRTPSLEFSTTATATSEEDFALPCRMLQTHESEDTDSIFSRSSSLRQDSRPGRSRLRLFQSLRSIKTSPSSSSLSSPNETCYSFVKKALQKLSRSNKKEKHRSRAWFLESWASFGKDDHLPATRYDPEGCEEDASIQDLPIELRRMEKEGENFLLDKDTSGQLLEVGLTQKSKSLNDIQSQSQPLASISAATPITRSRSRSSIVTADGYKIKIKTATAETTKEADMLKPKLVKQKKSICEEEFEIEKDEERDKPTDMKNLESEIPTLLVRKQKSMNEDILSGRQEEKKNVRQNIRKQISLNEDIIRGKQPRKQPSEDQLSMSVLVSASKSQLKNFRDMVVCSKDGATWYLKSSMTKIIQGIRSKEPVKPDTIPPPSATSPGLRKSNSEDRADEFAFDRRHSHEENSDSSKDNSLQSDASIDSEDSIISVIERVIPKSDQSSPTVLTSPGLHSPKLPLTGVLSHPSSPKISQVMQYPGAKAKALSLPASPRTLVMSPSLKQTFKIPPVAQHSTNGNGGSPSTIITPNGKVINGAGNGGSVFLLREATEAAAASSILKQTFAEDEPVLKLTPIKQVTAARLKSFNDREMLLLSQKLTKLSTKETEPRGADVCEGDDSHKVDTDAEQTLLSAVDQSKKKADQPAGQKSSESTSRSDLALVKKPSSSAQQVLGLSQQGRLSSLDIFNPETEDIDTDSSGVSTPDSVGSVISVRMESSNGASMTELEQPDLPDDGPLSQDELKKECSISSLPSASTRSLVTVSELSEMGTGPGGTKRRSSVAGPLEHPPSAPTRGLSFAGRLQGTSSLEETSTTKRTGATADIAKPEKRKSESKSLRKYPSLSKSPEKETWDIECRQRIVDLAENVTERLLAEMNRYKESNVIERERAAYPTSDRHADPYLTKLSEDLSHVSRLTEELSADLEAKVTGSSSDEDEELETNESDSPEEPELARAEEPDEDGRSSTTLLVKDEKHISGLISSDHSTDAESPGSISGWLDSRRNTIESGYWRDHASTAATDGGDEVRRSSVTAIYESARKSSQSETPHTRLSIESTDTMDVSERTVSSSEDSVSKRDTTQTETSSGLSVESDFCDLDKSADISKSTEYSATGAAGSAAGGGKPDAVGDIKYSASQASLLRPGESIESSDAGDISDRTGSVSDFSRQNTESRSVITQSSASLASWSDCSKDIRFADRRTARCDGRSSSEETNPRAVLTRQQAATQEPLEAKMASTGTSLSGSTSQDSLTSESAGGSIMFHRYYHVFREGELDALIDEFVENLHIISSYYDHTNWCIIAEKVRVWTI